MMIICNDQVARDFFHVMVTVIDELLKAEPPFASVDTPIYCFTHPDVDKVIEVLETNVEKNDTLVFCVMHRDDGEVFEFTGKSGAMTFTKDTRASSIGAGWISDARGLSAVIVRYYREDFILDGALLHHFPGAVPLLEDLLEIFTGFKLIKKVKRVNKVISNILEKMMFYDKGFNFVEPG